MLREDRRKILDKKVNGILKVRVAGLLFCFFFESHTSTIYLYNFVLNLGGRNRGREKGGATKWG